MTVYDLRCDACGGFLDSPGAGVRFVYHPGVPELRDDSGMMCTSCWAELTGGFGAAASGQCAACGAPAPRRQSLHVRPFAEPASWRLCAGHATGFLNALRTVQPKLDPATFRFPGAPPAEEHGRPASD